MTNTPAKTPEILRLSKLMADLGFCSRREADEWIAKGWVFVDGKQMKELGTKVSPHVKVEISEHAKREQQRLVTVILNKPVGWVSAHPENGYRPAVELLTAENYAAHDEPRVKNPRSLDNMAVAGRLDIDSQGLLVFTQDGRLARQLIQKDSEVEKEYLVRVRGDRLTGLERKEQLNTLRNGVLELDGKKLKRANVEWLNDDQLRIILREGKKRQVRRMCEAVGLFVTGLKRVRIGKLRLGDLPEGQWRFLDPDEQF